MERSIAESPRMEQELSQFAREAVDSFYARRIAELLYQRDARRDTASLSELDVESQHRYLSDAALPLRMRDAAWDRPAIYVSAHESGLVGDFGALAPKQRLLVLPALERLHKVYRQIIAGERAVDRRRFGLLALADLQEGEQV